MLNSLFKRSQQAYKSVFSLDNPDVALILRDLAAQAKIGKSASVIGKVSSDAELRELEGMRRMYWYITRKINLTVEEEREIIYGRSSGSE